MDSPSSRTKPAVPSNLADGPSPHEDRDKKERDSLYAQIQNLNWGRQVVNFDGPNEYVPKSSTGTNMDGSNCHERHKMVHGEIDVEEHSEAGPTKTPLATSRAQSPYTQHPTIDFDNLSWPSW